MTTDAEKLRSAANKIDAARREGLEYGNLDLDDEVFDDPEVDGDTLDEIDAVAGDLAQVLRKIAILVEAKDDA